MTRFRIWWSPMGSPNGSKVIETATKADAERAALAEMRRHSECGAYGADLEQEGGE